jgi:hypothetical protein
MFALGIGLGSPALAPAQTNPNNANISTGSGTGTTLGTSPGGLPSSTQIGRPGAGGVRPGYGRPIPPGSQAPGMNPGGGLDPVTGMPAAMDLQAAGTLTQADLDRIDARLLDDVRAITNPADRALGMERVALAKATSQASGDKRLDDAHIALQEGAEAALRVEDRVTRDIRLRLLVRTALLVAEEETREAVTDATEPDTMPDHRPWTARRRFDWMKKAEDERQLAMDLASRIENSTLRSEMLFRVVDSTSSASQAVAEKALMSVPGGKRFDLKGLNDMMARMADRGLVFSANSAGRISKPIWRDRAMVSISMAAAASDQFARGVEVSLTIPQPEYRSDALIRLAEAQARRNLAADATETYRQAASAVASIPIDDPRATLASVLIDSLVSVGRFDDARACVPFFPDSVRRLNALGTIAENQGERRLAQSAFAWIDREAPPELRDHLRLRVNAGVLHSFEKSRPNQVVGDQGTR